MVLTGVGGGKLAHAPDRSPTPNRDAPAWVSLRLTWRDGRGPQSTLVDGAYEPLGLTMPLREFEALNRKAKRRRRSLSAKKLRRLVGSVKTRFMDQGDPVIDAARMFLDELMPILKDHCPGPDDEAIAFPGPPLWVPETDMGLGMRRYKAVPRVFTVEQQCAARMLGELRAGGIEGLRELERALAADSVIGPRLDHEVSSSGAGGQTWQAQPMVQVLVDRVIADAGGFDLDPSLRDSLTSQWAETLRRPSDRMIGIVALREFRAETAPIRLAAGLEIDVLSDEEVAAALALGAGKIGLSIDERMISRTFGVRSWFDSRLFVGGVPPSEGEQEMAARQQARGRAELVLLALRLFKRGRVSSAGSFEFVISWGNDVSPASGSFGSGFGWHAADPLVLEAKDDDAFRKLWSALEKVHERPVLANALRRFTFAAERALPDDKIIDLLIAAESLFFSDISKSDRGEYRFRLSTRFALLLGETGDERRQIAKFVRHAYDARSGIVHGGDPGEKNLRALNGDRVTADECASELEEILRRALQVAISRLARAEKFPPVWEDLMFAN
jgi:hypothetical protein